MAEKSDCKIFILCLNAPIFKKICSIRGVRQSRKNINLFINWKIIYSSSDEDEESLSPELPSTAFSSSFSSFSCFPSLPFLCLVL